MERLPPTRNETDNPESLRGRLTGMAGVRCHEVSGHGFKMSLLSTAKSTALKPAQ